MKTIYITLFSIGLLAACGGSEESSEPTTTEDSVAVVEEQPEETIEKNPYGLSLNEGEPWEANQETTEGIAAIETIIVQTTYPEDTAAFTILEGELRKEYKLIFKRCTMKGEAHNQLHSYLMPLSEKMGRLAKGEYADRELAYQEVLEHLELYSIYFK